MRKMFHVTYDIITEASAEEGDIAEGGFVHVNGSRDPLERVENYDDYAMSLRSAVHHCWPHYDAGRWFERESEIEDFSTGNCVAYALHPPRDVTPSSYARLRRLFGVR